jgi:glycosyltransferase involved in cell wall biosynthesis
LFNPENPTIRREDLRRNLGLAEKFILFYHGTFSSTRGLTETIEAIKILKNKYHDIVFFLLGTGSTVAALRALIRKEGLLENVIIHNPVVQSEVPKFINMCDVCIVPLPNHPYWRHQSPLKLLEYLAMEKVVILTDIPAHRSIVGDADCGLYISSVNPTEIARAIEYAYFNKENLDERGKIGRRIIKEKYTWGKVARDLENYLSSINGGTN